MTEIETLKSIYSTNGYLVMASIGPLSIGEIKDDDWNEEDMREHKWSVIGGADRSELVEQNSVAGHNSKPSPEFRYFYRIVAMD